MKERIKKTLPRRSIFFHLTLYVVKDDPMDPEDQRKKAKSKPTLSLHLHFQLGHERFSADLPYAFT